MSPSSESGEATPSRSASGRRLLGNAAVYTLANIVNSAIPFLLLPLLTRWLDPRQYGLVALFTVLVNGCAAVAGLSVHGAVNVRFFDRAVDHPTYTGTALGILSASTGAMLVVVLALSTWLTPWLELPVGALLLAVLAAAAQFVTNVRLVIWQVRGEAVRYGLFQIGQMTLNLLLSLFLIGVVGLGWEGRVLGIAGAAVLFAAVGLLSLWRSGALNFRFNHHYARDALRFGVPLVPHAIGSLLIASSDRIIVAGVLDVHEAGIYAAGMQIGMVIGVLADATVKAVAPWVFERLANPDDALKRKLVRFTYLYFVGIASASIVFGLLAPHLLMLVGERFRTNGGVVGYVALGGAFSGMYLMVVNYIFFAKRNEFLAMASLSVGALNLLLSYLLVRSHGAVGAAQAYMVSQLVMFIVTWAIASKVYPMPWLLWRGSASRAPGA